MAEFLSEAWLAAFSTAVASVPRNVHDTEMLVVEQHVTGTPSGDVCYHIVFANDRIHVRTGAASEPDITVITDFETAIALHRGETNAQFAIASGGMKVRGAFDVLLGHATALDSLADAFSALRASTTFPASPTTASPVATPPGTSR